MEEANKLLPCPFCGGEAELIGYCSSWDDHRTIRNEGYAIGCLVNKCIILGYGGFNARDDEYGTFSSPVEASFAWNTRPSEAVEAGVDERAKALKDFDTWMWVESSDNDLVVRHSDTIVAALTQPSPPITDEKRKAALDALAKIDIRFSKKIHSFEEYDLWLGGWANEHIPIIKDALSQPDKTSVPQEVISLLNHAKKQCKFLPQAKTLHVDMEGWIDKALAILNGGKEKNHDGSQ